MTLWLENWSFKQFIHLGAIKSHGNFPTQVHMHKSWPGANQSLQPRSNQSGSCSSAQPSQELNGASQLFPQARLLPTLSMTNKSLSLNPVFLIQIRHSFTKSRPTWSFWSKNKVSDLHVTEARAACQREQLHERRFTTITPGVDFMRTQNEVNMSPLYVSYPCQCLFYQ